MRLTPHSARGFFLLAAFFIALPTLENFYTGQQGRFLIASPAIKSGAFHESVIYVVDHGLFTGARGYVINRPVPGAEGVFYGGPLAQQDHLHTFYHQGKSREYRGYAGWAPLQLEYEIIRGSWSVAPGDWEMVFSDDLNHLWRHLDTRARKGAAAIDAPVY